MCTHTRCAATGASFPTAKLKRRTVRRCRGPTLIVTATAINGGWRSRSGDGPWLNPYTPSRKCGTYGASPFWQAHSTRIVWPLMNKLAGIAVGWLFGTAPRPDRITRHANSVR